MSLKRDLRRQYRKGKKMFRGLEPGSPLHHRMSHRLEQLKKIIEEIQ